MAPGSRWLYAGVILRTYGDFCERRLRVFKSRIPFSKADFQNCLSEMVLLPKLI